MQCMNENFLLCISSFLYYYHIVIVEVLTCCVFGSCISLFSSPEKKERERERERESECQIYLKFIRSHHLPVEFSRSQEAYLRIFPKSTREHIPPAIVHLRTFQKEKESVSIHLSVPLLKSSAIEKEISIYVGKCPVTLRSLYRRKILIHDYGFVTD